MNIQDFLNRLDGVKRCGSNEYQAICPACRHDSKKLYVSAGDGGRILIDCKHGCAPAEIVAAMGLKTSDLFPETNKAPVVVSERKHIYEGETGNLLARKTIKKLSNGKKLPAIWERVENGTYKTGLNGLKPPLYHLPELLSDLQSTVYLVEGEKDVETMERMGFLATSSPNGAGAPLRKEHVETLRGRSVVILADNDDAGKKYAKKAAEQLYFAAAEVRVIPSESLLPGLKQKGDVSDVAAQIGEAETKLRVERLTRETAPAKVPGQSIIVEMPSFIYENNTGKHVNPALLAKAFREDHPFLIVKNEGQEKPWFYLYEGGVYRLRTVNEIQGILKDMISAFDESLVKMGDVKHAFENLQAEYKAIVAADDLNADETVINFQNGLLHLETMELKEHNPAILSTVQLPCAYDPNAPEPKRFQAFLRDLTEGDKAVETLLLQFIGLTISNVFGYRTKTGMFLFGKGNTGKSVFRNLLIDFVGKQNTFTVGIEKMDVRFALAGAFGKRLIGDSDMSFMRAKEIKNFKMLTGGDPVSFERKGVDRIDATYRGVVLFCTNQMPLFGGDKGDHVYNRMIPVPCNNVIPPEKQDKHLHEKMKAEYSGIVNLALIGLQQLKRNGYKFILPEKSKAALEKYKVRNSSARSFFESCCVMRADRDSCTVSKVFEIYKKWCADNGLYPERKKDFEIDIAAHLGVPLDDLKEKKNSGWLYKDFTLSIEAKETYRQIYGADRVTLPNENWQSCG